MTSSALPVSPHPTRSDSDPDPAVPAVPAGPRPAAPVVPARTRLRPLGVDDVCLRGGFWGRRQQVNAARTLAHVEHWLEHEGWLANFDDAARGRSMAGRRGREFSDSEVYKLLEAMAWELGRGPAPDLQRRFDGLVARVAAAQEPDGYVGTAFGREGQAPRYSDLAWGHELYCQGHLAQAAVARVRTGHPDDPLVAVARRSAEHVCSEFGAGGREGVCGHPEIEVGLVELGRALDEPRFVAQAALFVERRGHGTLPDIELGSSYFQDDVPVRDATVLRGHAVRANYLAAAALDVADETGDDGLRDAVRRQWDRTVARRTYVTGGQGARHIDEAYGEDFALPADRAYSETCAAIASVMVSWRLLLATGDARYGDLVERTLHNVVATSPSRDGDAFFYSHTLHRREPGEEADPDVASARAETSLRAPWFAVSCCPTNVARTFASLSGYVATTDDHGVQVHLLAPAAIDTGDARILVETGLPDGGEIVLRVEAGPETDWTLSVRVPAWSDASRLVRPDGTTEDVGPGYARVTGLRPGDEVRLRLDLTPRFVHPDPRIDAVRGCVAVQRGPLVWCLESVDLPDGLGHADLDRVRVDASRPPEWRDGRVHVTATLAAQADDAWPYGPELSPAHAGETLSLPLTPYHDWAERGPSTMRLWLPTT